MKRLIVFFLIVLIALMAGCARTKQTATIEKTGFLGDYSKLQKGKAGEEVLVYKNPQVYWPGYDKILLDPVTVWRGEKTKVEGIPEEDIQTMIDNFYAMLHAELAKDYKMVKEQNPEITLLSILAEKIKKKIKRLKKI